MDQAISYKEGGRDKECVAIFHCNTVLYDGRNKISHGLAMRDGIGTLGKDFALGEPRAKGAKSVLRVPILSLMANPREILYSYQVVMGEIYMYNDLHI
jgi:hypothetical protein